MEERNPIYFKSPHARQVCSSCCVVINQVRRRNVNSYVEEIAQSNVWIIIYFYSVSVTDYSIFTAFFKSLNSLPVSHITCKKVFVLL